MWMTHGRTWIGGTLDEFDALKLALQMKHGIRFSFFLAADGTDRCSLSFAFINEELEEPEYSYWMRVTDMARKIGMNVKADGLFAPKEEK